MKRYYLKAYGSICYNTVGISSPIFHPIDFLKIPLIKNPRWAKQFGWSNQPHVLTFNLPDSPDAIRKVEAWLVDQCPISAFYIAEHWNNKA